MVHTAQSVSLRLDGVPTAACKLVVVFCSHERIACDKLEYPKQKGRSSFESQLLRNKRAVEEHSSPVIIGALGSFGQKIDKPR